MTLEAPVSSEGRGEIRQTGKKMGPRREDGRTKEDLSGLENSSSFIPDAFAVSLPTRVY